MKFVLPYQDMDNGRNTTDHKEKVTVFIKQLQLLGFPKENIQEQESEVTIETDNTVLCVKYKRDGSSFMPTQLCYGNQDLITLREKYDLWDRCCFIRFHEENNAKLPPKLGLDKKEIENEKSVVDKIARRERKNIPKRLTGEYEIRGKKLYSIDDLEQHLKPIITNEWVKNGYKDDALESKVERTLEQAFKKFQEFADEDYLAPTKIQRMAKLKQLFFCCSPSRTQVHPQELSNHALKA